MGCLPSSTSNSVDVCYGMHQQITPVAAVFGCVSGLVDTLSPVLHDLAQRLHFQQHQLQELLQQQQQQQQSFTAASAAAAESLVKIAETSNGLLGLWATAMCLVTDDGIAPTGAGAGVTPAHLSAAAAAIAASWPCEATLRQNQGAAAVAAAQTMAGSTACYLTGSARLPGPSLFKGLHSQVVIGLAASQLVRQLARWPTQDAGNLRAAAAANLNDMVWVVMVFLSFVTQLIHAQQQGCSPINQHGAMLASRGGPSDSCSSSTDKRRTQPQQGMQVPAYHEQLLSAVGLSSYQPGDFGITAGLSNAYKIASLLTVLPGFSAESTRPDSTLCLTSALHDSQGVQAVPPCSGPSNQECGADNSNLAGDAAATTSTTTTTNSSNSRGSCAEALPPATRATASGSPRTDQCMEGTSRSSSSSSGSNHAAADMPSVANPTNGSSTNTSTSMLTDDVVALLHLFAPVLIELVALQPKEPLLEAVVAGLGLAVNALRHSAVQAAADSSPPDAETHGGAAGQAGHSDGVGWEQQQIAAGARLYIAMLQVLVPVYQHITAAVPAARHGLQQQSVTQRQLGDAVFGMVAMVMHSWMGRYTVDQVVLAIYAVHGMPCHG